MAAPQQSSSDLEQQIKDVMATQAARDARVRQQQADEQARHIRQGEETEQFFRQKLHPALEKVDAGLRAAAPSHRLQYDFRVADEGTIRIVKVSRRNYDQVEIDLDVWVGPQRGFPDRIIIIVTRDGRQVPELSGPIADKTVDGLAGGIIDLWKRVSG